MTKKLFSLLLALAIVWGTMCALPLTASAANSGTCGENLTWTLDDNGTLTISGTGEMEDYYSSTDIPWFSSRDKIVTVKIDSSVQHIGEFGLFYGCTSLKNIEVKSENAAYTSINGILFNKDKTTLLCYPAGKTVTNYTIPDGVTSIGDSAFVDCSLKSVIIPGSVTTIGNQAFYDCTSLTSVTIPDSVTSIGSGAFEYCSSLTSITIPNSVTSIEYRAFSYCSSLTSVSIPSSVTNIDHEAFGGCTSLTGITIPDSVTSIGDSAFSGCNSLTNVTIPDNVTSIGSSAFGGCSSLTSIEVQTENVKYTSTDGILFNKDKTILLCYPAGKAETKHTIPDCVTSIGNSAFSGCNSLISITVPDNVTSIGSSAFGGCSSLTSVTIPDSVTSIGLFAFIACSSLTSITIPSSVTSIDPGTFFDCSSLTSITIPDSVMKIGNTAFYGCDDLTIKGYTNSYAQTYANKHGIPFESLSCDDNTHIYGDWVIDRAASCTEKGLKHRECEACHEVESDDIAALGHDYDTEWTIDTPATETTPGSKSHHCKVCDDKTDIIEIPATGTENVTENYVDVVPDEWYVSAVQYAVDNSLFFGVSDNEFAPDVAMNRAMLVTVLWRLEGKPTVSAENKFTDVPAGEWYTNAVIWASENGVVYGTSETEFSPEDSITREQMATILYRYAKKKGYDVTASTDLNTFPDSGNASSYARDALSWACGAGLIFGSDGKLLPQDGATRAQVAAILMRYTKKVVQK